MAIVEALPDDLARRYHGVLNSPRFQRQPRNDYDPGRRVVITGMGTINALGHNLEQTWQNVRDGRGGITPIEIPYSNVHNAAYVKDFDPNTAFQGIIVDREERNKFLARNERPTYFAVKASHEALLQSGLLGPDGRIDPAIAPDIGAFIGTGIGGAHYIAESMQKLLFRPTHDVDSGDLLKELPERVMSVPSMIYGTEGPGYTNIAACATSSTAFSAGVKEILLGRCDIAMVGGVDAPFIVYEEYDYRDDKRRMRKGTREKVLPVVIANFEKLGALSTRTDPNNASLPFDEDHNGFIPGEGAGVLVLETLESARRRGVPIIAEVAGWGEALDAYHETLPSGRGAVRAIRLATRDERFQDYGPIYVNAHATGTPGTADGLEALSVRYALEGQPVAGISAPKSMIGHTLGGTAVETVIAIKGMQENTMPPTINLKNPIAELGELDPVQNEAEPAEFNRIVKNTFGFGGINSVLYIARYY